jgi:SAM-dependent MidA family methyltransferase
MNELAEILRREVSRRGVISFAQFMELSLYCPLHGYYERHAEQVGCQGDFYTSVSVGSLFGELLAFQFAEWLNPNPESAALPPAEAVQLVEAGTHDGQLALDVLSALDRTAPRLFERLEYWILEPSPLREERQRAKLQGFASKIRWFQNWTELPNPVRGVIFSNELLDAFPVHRIGWDAARGKWFEWGVAWSGEHWIWQRTEPLEPLGFSYPDLPEELLEVLPDGFTTELCPAAERWWHDAAQALGEGKLMAIDYGLEELEFFQPERRRGTLRACARHHLSDDPLASPGEQDLTAHVNFSAIERAGLRAGLKTATFETQAQYLTQLAGKFFESGAPAWDAKRLRQFQTLVHPEHLGRSFRVFIQAREPA